MAYKTILVHLDETEASAKRVEAALKLGADHDAHVTALAFALEPYAPSYVLSYIPAETLTDQRHQAEARAQRLVADFAERAGRAGLSHEARIVSCMIDEASPQLAVHARYADLVIMGQAGEGTDAKLADALVEEAIFGCGRPLLIAPYIGLQGHGLGETVMIAWDASREAARAVSDAMPLLTRANKVVVFTVNAEPSAEGHGQAPGSDIAHFLARHGVSVEVAPTHAKGIAPEDVILSALADHGADLLVMGAYGHSRLRELILGGVTHTILRHMPVPVLMSH